MFSDIGNRRSIFGFGGFRDGGGLYACDSARRKMGKQLRDRFARRGGAIAQR